MASRKMKRSSEIGKILLEEESGSVVDDSDADSYFQIINDHDTESEYEVEVGDEHENNESSINLFNESNAKV